MRNIKYLLIITISILSFNSFAQIVTFRSGINYSNSYKKNEYGNREYTSGSKSGMNIGLIFNFPTPGNNSIETGIQFENKGYSFNDYRSSTASKGIVDIQYISIPLLYKIHHKLNRNSDISFGLGVYGAAKLSDMVKDNTQTTHLSSSYNSQSSSFSDNIPQFDLGYTVGLGAKFAFISFGVYYDFSMQFNIKDEHEIDYIYIDKGFKNNSLRLNIGFSFGSI